eukprot:snap_masked-scaffold_80-processed-gene-0.10-mRNA-1 protein AED:1.00 eAED:1.00 QI:0/-1/0/0/-1/1/1/0/609
MFKKRKKRTGRNSSKAQNQLKNPTIQHEPFGETLKENFKTYKRKRVLTALQSRTAEAPATFSSLKPNKVPNQLPKEIIEEDKKFDINSYMSELRLDRKTLKSTIADVAPKRTLTPFEENMQNRPEKEFHFEENSEDEEILEWENKIMETAAAKKRTSLKQNLSDKTTFVKFSEKVDLEPVFENFLNKKKQVELVFEETEAEIEKIKRNLAMDSAGSETSNSRVIEEKSKKYEIFKSFCDKISKLTKEADETQIFDDFNSLFSKLEEYSEFEMNKKIKHKKDNIGQILLEYISESESLSESTVEIKKYLEQSESLKKRAQKVFFMLEKPKSRFSNVSEEFIVEKKKEIIEVKPVPREKISNTLSKTKNMFSDFSSLDSFLSELSQVKTNLEEIKLVDDYFLNMVLIFFWYDILSDTLIHKDISAVSIKIFMIYLKLLEKYDVSKSLRYSFINDFLKKEYFISTEVLENNEVLISLISCLAENNFIGKSLLNFSIKAIIEAVEKYKSSFFLGTCLMETKNSLQIYQESIPEVLKLLQFLTILFPIIKNFMEKNTFENYIELTLEFFTYLSKLKNILNQFLEPNELKNKIKLFSQYLDLPYIQYFEELEQKT